MKSSGYPQWKGLIEVMSKKSVIVNGTKQAPS